MHLYKLMALKPGKSKFTSHLSLLSWVTLSKVHKVLKVQFFPQLNRIE